MNSKEIARLACEAMEDKKAQDIKIINIEQVSTLAVYFIISRPAELTAIRYRPWQIM